MKCKLDLIIGEGFCTSKPIPVEIEFADGVIATFHMTALGQKEALELLDDGVDLEKIKEEEDIRGAIEATRKTFKKFVHGWDWKIADGREIPFTEENLHEVAGDQKLGRRLIDLAQDLGVKEKEETEKNSEDSSVGTSEPVTSH